MVSTPNAQTTTENHAAIALTGLSLTPADVSASDANDTYNVTLSVNDGSLAVSSHDGLTGSFNGASIIFSGSLTDVNAALGHVSYTPTSEFEGQDTLTFTSSTTEEATVGGATSTPVSHTATITVNGVPETAMVSTPNAQTTTENHAAIALTGLSLTPADASASDANDTYNVTLSVNDGSLAVSSHDGLTGSFNGASITFSGSLTSVNAALGHASYTPTSEFEGPDTLTFTSSTTEDVGDATSTPVSHTATITVTPLAPVFTSPASISGTAQEGVTLTAGGTLNESDVVVTYQWQSSSNGTSNWHTITTNGTSQTYTPTEADEGLHIRVMETATDSDGGPSTTSTSAATAAVAEAALVPSITAGTNTSGSQNGTATFIVKFAVPVAGVTSADFVPFSTGSGTTTGDIIAVSGSGANYTVTVTYKDTGTGSHKGQSLGLNFVNPHNAVQEGGDGTPANSTNITTPQFSSLAPAGIAGYAIDMGLTDPTADPSDAITMTIAGAPADWTLNSGTHNSDGSWTVLTHDPASLMVTPSASFVGAALVYVTETWTNPDGTTGSALITDNVEAYAPGSPIFALAGDDNLTGTGASDLFVFAQPIGHDVIYNFNAASDKIDLIGFDGVSSFADIQGHIADDANGNAVITIGAHETITLNGVHAASVTADDFAFDQTPVTQNAGSMTIGDGAILPLSGTINNTGTIELNSAGNETDLQLTGHGMTLQGGGHVVLSDSAENVISGTSADVTLTNVDNTISGAGQIGGGQLTLINDSHGTIAATGTLNQLTIDTGSGTFTNHGTVLSEGAGGLEIKGGVISDGLLEASSGVLKVDGNVSGGGHAVIDGGSIEFGAASDASVAFSGNNGGTLVLDQPDAFTGQIAGINGSSDVLDLHGLNAATTTAVAGADSYDAVSGITTLTVTDTSLPSGQQIETFKLTGDLSGSTWTVSDDHHGGVDIVDPPATTGQNAGGVAINDPGPAASQTIVASAPNQILTGLGGSDNFVFNFSGFGQDTVTNFHPDSDALQFDHSIFTTAQSAMDAIHDDGLGNAVLVTGHDTITLAGVLKTQLHTTDFHIV
jgi:VCBS repeat-containing protein